MIIYIVYEYYTDEMCLAGVFSSREKAEGYLKRTPKLGVTRDIEEYELDGGVK